MKCYECGGRYSEFFGNIIIQDDIIGNIEVNDVKYYKCNQCGELLFPRETLSVIEDKEKKILDALIGRLPLDDFISSTTLAEILNISRQAIHKHHRINNGFIYSKIHEGRRLYSRKSSVLYRETGDGRFPLIQHIDEPVYTAIVQDNTAYTITSTSNEIDVNDFDYERLLSSMTISPEQLVRYTGQSREV